MSDPRELVSVYKAANQVEAHLVMNLLLNEEIDAQVADENIAYTGLTFANSEVFVRRADEAKALAIIDRYEEQQIERAERPDWKCPSCAANVVGAFDECDACGAARPGTEEPPDEEGLEEN